MTAAPQPLLDDLVLSRMLELFDHRTPWHRSLWQIGTKVGLLEVAEYGELLQEAAVKTEGLDFVRESMIRQVRRDRGVGGPEVAEKLEGFLSVKAGDKTAGLQLTSRRTTLLELGERSSDGYLLRWAELVEKGQVAPGEIELLSRLAAAHMLDAGFSGNHLHGWLKSCTDGASPKSLPEVLADADGMLTRPVNEYEILVPFKKLPPAVVQEGAERYVSSDDFEELVADFAGAPSGRRKGAGALRFEVSARDPWSAVASVEAEVRRLSARVAVGLSADDIEDISWAVLPAARRWRKMQAWRKQVKVPALSRHNMLLGASDRSTSPRLDDALELLAALEQATSWASVATAWAAIEGLLAIPSEAGVRAADRLAAIVTCSFPRAEATQLVENWRSSHSAGADNAWLRRSDVPMTEKIARMLTEVDNGQLAFSETAHLAAIERYKTLRRAPKEILGRTSRYYQDAFRRLFYQRNLVMHSARFNSVSLPVTLRTAPSLVAAGIDRLVHAEFRNPPLSPLQLAARAEVELDLLDGSAARDVSRLLD